MVNHDDTVHSNCGSDCTSDKINFLDNSVINSGRNRDEHRNTVCSNCGSDYVGSNWCRTYNKDGNWDGKYHCAMCHKYYNSNTGKFSRNPKIYNKHENTKCVKCGSDKSSSNWLRLYDENHKWDYKSYVCKKCHEKYDSNSKSNIIKSMAQFRNGDLDPNSAIGKGFRVVQCIAKVLEIEDCNIKLDNFKTGIDLYHEKYGKIEVKASSYSLKRKNWKIGNISYRIFNTLYITCMDSNFENVIRIYRMSKKDVGGVSTITINKNSSKYDWYEKFRIDERSYQEAFKSMSIRNCKYLKSDTK